MIQPKHLDLPVTAENIQKLLKAAGIKVAAYWPGLFENLVKERGVAELMAAGIHLSIACLLYYLIHSANCIKISSM